jgi:hypothetical protein
MKRFVRPAPGKKLKESHMSFRVSVPVAVAALLAVSSVTPAFGQPIAPVRPRSSAFGTIFTPGLQQQQFQQQQFLNQALGLGGVGLGGAPLGGGWNPALGAGGFGYPGQLAYQGALPGAYAPAPLLASSGVVGTFNNLGHWYGGGRGGNLGHWYPNGVASGRGILGYGGGTSGGFAGGVVGPVGGAAGRGGSLIGNVGGTALGIGATMNQFRR